MNSIRQIQELNKRELENGVSPDASWHTDYRDTAYIYIGGLPFDLSEGDIITIFSQYGEPTYVNLVRDKDNGKSKGFAFLKYEDQRSTDLAVDNLGGTTIMGRMLRVDHTRYKKKDDETDEGMGFGESSAIELVGDRTGDEGEDGPAKQLLPEEKELAALINDHDEDDPMKAFLVQEKKDEVLAALSKIKDQAASGKEHKRRHHHHRSHHSSRYDKGATHGYSRRHLADPERRSRSGDGLEDREEYRDGPAHLGPDRKEERQRSRSGVRSKRKEGDLDGGRRPSYMSRHDA